MIHSMQVLEHKSLQQVIDYEEQKLLQLQEDETERMFKAWHAKWRKESLEHYLPMGWSFVAKNDQGAIVGYFLAQPLLFIEGFTQALWVEHLQFDSVQIRDELCELAYKIAREKHLQKVYFPKESNIEDSVRRYKSENWDPKMLSVKTTRM